MPADIRMRGFQQRSEVSAVVLLIEERLHPLGTEPVNTMDAAGRVLAAEIIAPVPVPGFDRAAMDGYALRGRETFSADSYSPIEFTIVGESFPTRPFIGTVQPGQVVRIMTGAPLPDGADAVLQAEAAAEINDTQPPKVRVFEAVAPGRHVGHRGEDIAAGTVLLHAGRTLRPQDLGVLASVGASPVSVYMRPSVAILVTGDELLPCGAKPEGYQIVDSNSPMLAALARRDGAACVRIQMVRDRKEMVHSALQNAVEDVVLISGGSSVGLEDHAPRVLSELGEVPIHGVALRPASPTGLGFIGNRPVFLLPGNPVSCLCAYDLFAGPALRRMGGKSMALPYPARSLPLADKIASAVGRVDYVRIVIHGDKAIPLAISGASILSSTTRADGFVLVPGDLEGYAEGDVVQVFCYDNV